jgi:hypothetical protein
VANPGLINVESCQAIPLPGVPGQMSGWVP